MHSKLFYVQPRYDDGLVWRVCASGADTPRELRPDYESLAAAFPVPHSGDSKTQPPSSLGRLAKAVVEHDGMGQAADWDRQADPGCPLITLEPGLH